jgi:hypothetical protein
MYDADMWLRVGLLGPVALLVLAPCCGGPAFGNGSSRDAGPDAGEGGACQMPTGCPALQWECGAGMDACGRQVDCGSCSHANTSCVAHVCKCAPFSCSDFSAQCGQIPDGCGGTRSCGSCPAGQTCGGGGFLKCGTGPCTPKSCAQQGATCGQVEDGCGNLLLCGMCSPPATCGGGGMMNQCGCKPQTCSTLGWQCGMGSDGCGGMLTCGVCGIGQTCDANSHACACSPQQTCTSLGYACGAFTDSCGALEMCGPAPVAHPELDFMCPDPLHPPYYECVGASGDAGGTGGGPTPPESGWDCAPQDGPPADAWCCAQ